jgi:flagellar motor switch protein FliG
MQNLNYESLTGQQKAAIVLIALGSEASAAVLKLLSDLEIETLTKEIISLKDVHSQVKDRAIEEFYHMMLAREYVLEGGYEYAKKILFQAVGVQRANDIIERVRQSVMVKGFNILKGVDPKQLLNFVQKEHPQTIALVLSQLEAEQAALVMSELPENIRIEVAYRMATLDQVSPDVIRGIEEVLETKIDFDIGTRKLGGPKAVAAILNMVGRNAEKSIMDDLREIDNQLATEIKNLMFVFEDIVFLDDKGIQRVLKDINSGDLALALKAASDELKERILSNISSRAAENLMEEIQYLGPVRLRDVEEAQKRIVDAVRALDEAGEIVIGAGSKDEIVE